MESKMKYLEWLIQLTKSQLPGVPERFGDLHLLCIFAVLVISLLVIILFSDTSDKCFRIIIGAAFLVMLIGECVKQIVYPLSVVDGQLVFNYSWWSFPFQLCSTPIYVLPLLCFLPDCKVRNLAAAYVMTYGFLGGVAVYISPGSVFCANKFLSYHSMLHHGLQILMGAYTMAYYRHRIKARFLAGGVFVFTLMFTIANLLNTVGYEFLVKKGLLIEGAEFNMFYISPRPDQLPAIFPELRSYIGATGYIAGYFVVVTIGAILVPALVGSFNKSVDEHMNALYNEPNSNDLIRYL